MNIESQVGPQILADGAHGAIRLGKTGESVVQQLHGRYYEAAYRGRIFVAHAAAQAMTIAQASMVGLQLWNGSPISAGVNLVLMKCAGNIVATSATVTSIVLASGTGQASPPTGQTAATRVANAFLGQAAPNATATSAAVFTNAPTALWSLLHNTAAINTVGVDGGWQMDFDGAIIVPPQSWVCLATVGATAAAGAVNASIMWEEVPA
jgi:hypothetical protein